MTIEVTEGANNPPGAVDDTYSTPEDTALSHRLFTAALESERRKATVVV